MQSHMTELDTQSGYIVLFIKTSSVNMTEESQANRAKRTFHSVLFRVSGNIFLASGSNYFLNKRTNRKIADICINVQKISLLHVTSL